MKILNKLCVLAMLIGTIAIPAPAQNNAKTPITPTAVDMGLSVKWSNIELGAPSKTSAGKLYSIDENVISKLGDGWKLPTKNELQELFDNSKCEIKLTQAGIPSHIELTSKKNGAKINIYIPKIAAEKDGKVVRNPIKSQGEMWSVFLSCQNKEGCAFIAIGKLPNELVYQFKTEFAKVGIKSMDPNDWPDEVQEELKKQFRKANGDDVAFFFDNKLSYMGNFIWDDELRATKAYILPAFSLDDDE